MSLTKNVNGVILPLSADEEAAEQARWVAGALELAAKRVEQTRLAAIDVSIKNDTQIASLKAMPTDDFDAWWDANVTNFSQASNVLKRIARLVLRKL